MTRIKPRSPGADAALERAGLLRTPDVESAINSACAEAGVGEDSVLEISQGGWATDGNRGDALIVLVRGAIVLARPQRRKLLGAGPSTVRSEPLERFSDLIEDDETADQPGVFLLGEGDPDTADHLLLLFTSAEERDRLFHPIFLAQRDSYEIWGMQLDPADYVADFDRFYAEMQMSGVSGSDAREWAESEYGEFDITNALGFAVDWHRAVESDMNPVAGNPSSRVGRLVSPWPWLEAGREVARLLARLGEELFDEGALGPPYDERSFNIDEPLTSVDAGPGRLLALMTLASCATQSHHPRAEEWLRLAEREVPGASPSIFGELNKKLWLEVSSVTIPAERL